MTGFVAYLRSFSEAFVDLGRFVWEVVPILGTAVMHGPVVGWIIGS